MGRVKRDDAQPELGRFRPIIGAFMELSTERQIGMAIGPIPLSKIEEYLSRHGLPEWWCSVISAADRMALKLYTDDEVKKNAA